jgi:hypothetical protein
MDLSATYSGGELRLGRRPEAKSRFLRVCINDIKLPDSTEKTGSRQEKQEKIVGKISELLGD